MNFTLAPVCTTGPTPRERRERRACLGDPERPDPASGGQTRNKVVGTVGREILTKEIADRRGFFPKECHPRRLTAEEKANSLALKEGVRRRNLSGNPWSELAHSALSLDPHEPSKLELRGLNKLTS